MPILEWLKILVPGVVALAVFFVTWTFYRWQVRLAKQKLRHELFDRRFAIYLAFQDLLLALPEKRDDEITAAFRKASTARLEARFLFDDPKIHAYLESLCEQVNDNVIRDIVSLDAVREAGALTNNPQVVRDFTERASHLGASKLNLPDRHLGELSERFVQSSNLTDYWKTKPRLWAGLFQKLRRAFSSAWRK